MGSSKKVWCLPREVVDGFVKECDGILRLPEPTDCIHEGLMSLIRKHGKLLKRKEAEGNKDWVQIVVGGLVFINGRNGNKLLVMKRYETEERLKGLYTAYVGGHLEELDIMGECMREIEEELGVSDYVVIGTPFAIWYPVNDVSEEHLGVIYAIYTADDKIKNNELEYELLDKDELKTVNKDSWTEAIANLLEVYGDAL